MKSAKGWTPQHSAAFQELSQTLRPRLACNSGANPGRPGINCLVVHVGIETRVFAKFRIEHEIVVRLYS